MCFDRQARQGHAVRMIVIAVLTLVTSISAIADINPERTPSSAIRSFPIKAFSIS
jgi:hypothetical protein